MGNGMRMALAVAFMAAVAGCSTLDKIGRVDRYAHYFDAIEPLAVAMGELGPGQTITTTMDCMTTQSCTESERIVHTLMAMGWTLESTGFEQDGSNNHKWVLKYTKK
jgi:hypothetical protein